MIHAFGVLCWVVYALSLFAFGCFLCCYLLNAIPFLAAQPLSNQRGVSPLSNQRRGRESLTFTRCCCCCAPFVAVQPLPNQRGESASLTFKSTAVDTLTSEGATILLGVLLADMTGTMLQLEGVSGGGGSNYYPAAFVNDVLRWVARG